MLEKLKNRSLLLPMLLLALFEKIYATNDTGSRSSIELVNSQKEIQAIAQERRDSINMQRDSMTTLHSIRGALQPVSDALESYIPQSKSQIISVRKNTQNLRNSLLLLAFATALYVIWDQQIDKPRRKKDANNKVQTLVKAIEYYMGTGGDRVILKKNQKDGLATLSLKPQYSNRSSIGYSYLLLLLVLLTIWGFWLKKSRKKRK